MPSGSDHAHIDSFQALLQTFVPGERIFIQTHNVPDHDAVATAYALQRLLDSQRIPATLIYDGGIYRNSLKRMIEQLGIEIRPVAEIALTVADKIIVVDGCKGNRNVTELTGDEVAVIDHHRVSDPGKVPFIDIRPDYGACVSIVGDYYSSLQVSIPAEVATAMMIAINMDTAQLTRGVSGADLDLYRHCHALADTEFVNSIVRNQLRQEDLPYYGSLANQLQTQGRSAYCYFPEGCCPNMLGILADFALSLEEVDFVLLCANNQSIVNFSARSELSSLNASRVIQEVLEGVGFGGGHAHMAGGAIRDIDKFCPDLIQQRFLGFCEA